MTDIHVHRPLSRVELIVLARLSTPTPPTHTDIVKSLTQIGIPLNGTALNDCATATLVALQDGGLAAQAPTTSARKKVLRYGLTDGGRLVLRNAVGLKATPSWKEMRDRVVPALVLGEQPGDDAADAALGSFDA